MNPTRYSVLDPPCIVDNAPGTVDILPRIMDFSPFTVYQTHLKALLLKGSADRYSLLFCL